MVDYKIDIERNLPCKLKKCPWCKKEPVLIKREKIINTTACVIMYYVQCNNDECKIQPTSRTYYTKEINDIDESIAIKKACDIWNDRGGNNEEK